MRPAAIALLAALLLGACAAYAPFDGPRAAPGTLHDSDGRYVLDRPFRDFYDTAFILTDAGTRAPRVVSLDRLASRLAAFDVVFYGETHDHTGIHVEQMRLLAALVARNPDWILSLEQFDRDTQSVLDDYLASRVGETALIDKGRAWKNYAESYRPLVLFAKAHHLPVIAAEAPDWTINCIGQWGPQILDRFTPDERSWVAQRIDAAPGPYRDKFMAFMGSSPTHGGGPAATPEAQRRAQNSFTAQVARDATMAESIDRARRAHPGYQVLHLTGSFHAAGFLGTVERLRSLDPTLKIAVVSPVEVEDPHAPSFTKEDAREGTVIELVYPSPEPFVEGEDTSTWMARMSKVRETSRCRYTPESETHSEMPASR